MTATERDVRNLRRLLREDHLRSEIEELQKPWFCDGCSRGMSVPKDYMPIKCAARPDEACGHEGTLCNPAYCENCEYLAKETK